MASVILRGVAKFLSIFLKGAKIMSPEFINKDILIS
jgi:hypothetical protein